MRKITVLLALLAVIVSCTTIDCPLNNSVYARYRLAGDVTTLGDTLTISTTRTAGSDTVLLNKALGVDSFNLPLSYQHAQDVFYIDIRPQGAARTLDTVTVSKTNEPHFESVDCASSVFHTLTGVSSTHHRIDSIAIQNPQVTYDAAKAHLLIYFKARRD